MGGILIEQDLFVTQNIVDSTLPEGQKIHDFLMSRAELLAGKYIDFDKTPVTFLLADKDEPNAFFSPISDPPSRNRDRNIIYTNNPLGMHVICVTKGLIDFVDNLDQLDHVIGHELTHMILRDYGVEKNSKGEEELADLHAVDLVYDAGGDPKQALVMADKINAYVKNNHRHNYDDSEEGINWSEILDVHMTHGNRKAALEASLTRISHLIDDRVPSDFDKSIFNVEYTDPLEVFLKTNDYKNQEPLRKLKILIDAIEHLSVDTNPKDYRPDEDEIFLDRKPKRFDIQQRLRYGHKSIFKGKIVDKKYQQKMANLAEEIINSVKDSSDLLIDLQNKAYQHIQENGYPNSMDLNYLDASGIIYSYFYSLLANKVSHKTMFENEGKPVSTKIKLVSDINDIKDKIKNAKTPDGLVQSYADLNALYGVLIEIRNTNSGGHYGESKLDNLSLYDSRYYQNDRTQEIKVIYDRTQVKGGSVVPWNNLIPFVQNDKKAKKCLKAILKAESIIDYRVTHDAPYIEVRGKACYKIDKNGALSNDTVPDYEIEFILKRKKVLKSYDYIKTYFDNEDEYFDKTCASALVIDDHHFREFEAISNGFNRHSIADQRFYNLVFLFHSLPDNSPENRSWKNSNVFSLISGRYQEDNLVPGKNKKGKQTISSDLFEFNNSIFQQYFGESFKEKLIERKEKQQQKLFDTAFEVAKKLPVMWNEARLKTQDLSEKNKVLFAHMDALPDGEEKKKARKNWEHNNTELGFYKKKQDQLKFAIMNCYNSIFEERNNRWNLSHLLPTQKRKMAEYAVKDETGILRKIFANYGYESFYDYLNILVEQTEQVLLGNNELTDMMQVVADHHDYKTLNTREELENFIDNRKKDNYRETRYVSFLCAFDLARYLDISSEFDILTLSKILSQIKQFQPDGFGHRSKDDLYRFEAYKKFMTQDGLISSIAQAVNLKSNYDGLTFDQHIETIDGLVNLRTQMAELIKEKEKRSSWGNNFYDEDINPWKIKILNYANNKLKKLTNVFKKAVGIKKVIPPLTTEQKTQIRNKKFLNLLDKNIRGLIRQSQHQILQRDNALDKITGLYWLYHGEEKGYSSDLTRTKYLNEITKKENIFNKISNLAEDDDFWPKDILEHVRAYIFAKNTFIDDIAFENILLNKIFDAVENLPSGKKKNECLYTLLDKRLRASYPETRQRLFDIYADDLLNKIGKDDGSKKYKNRLSLYLKAIEGGNSKDWDIGEGYSSRHDILSNEMSSADKYILLRKVSDTILSQEKTSAMMKENCQISLNANNLASSYLYGVGVDYLTSEMDRDPKTANKFIQFLNSKGEVKDCENISSFIEDVMNERHNDRHDRGYLDKILKSTQPVNCKVLYENFWSAPLEARAVIIARMLKSAVVEQTSDNKIDTQHSWEKVFNVVMENIISVDDTSVEARYAQDIMHSYIKSRSDYERELILSAMMVANRNIGSDAGNVGKALKLFLENMGPAEIKLGQAISSYPNTPDSIKNELQDLKNAADMPARWTIYDWIKNENIPKKYWKNKYLGEILGSASYYTTVAVGDDEVLRMLRPEAREKANKGFRVINDMVDDLKEKDTISELDYKELTTSVYEMVKQAAKMSGIETNHDIGQKQYEDAKNLYNGVTITSGAETFKLQVMDWTAKGKNWMEIKRAKGHTFNDLPEDTSKQITYKKQFAKGYITFEIVNILSGKKFDHDKHGAQLCIDRDTNKVGIFDTGAMALNDPTPIEQKSLGHVIYYTIKSTMSGEQFFIAFNHAISDKIDELHKDNIDTQYLVEVKKGVLALGDFFNILDKYDIQETMPGLEILTDISETIRKGVFDKMSKIEQEQLQILSTTNEFARNKNIIVHRGKAPIIANDVTNVNTKPIQQGKSAWLQKAL